MTDTGELVKRLREYDALYGPKVGQWDAELACLCRDVVMAADALEAAERVIADFDRWMDSGSPVDAPSNARSWLAAHATGQRNPLFQSCSMGWGCDEAGTCYAAAHGEPERCPKARDGT